MSLEDKNKLSREEKEKLAQQKLQEVLKEQLLKIGGEDVEFLENTFSMQINIYKKGKIINPLQQSILFGEDDFECEIQSLKIYRDNQKDQEFNNLQFLSGFALHKTDQVWRLHSWLQYQSKDIENDAHLRQNQFAKREEKLIQKQSEQKEEEQNKEEEEQKQQELQQQQEDDLDQVSVNKEKYKQIIQDNKFIETSNSNNLITVETTIDEIELYYGYIADKKEIQLRTQSVEQYFDSNNNNLNDENMEDLEDDEDLEDIDGEDWEDDDGDENWEDDEEDDQ